MGTNYYFRKKGIDAARINAIADELNDKHIALVETYNEKLRKAYEDMGIECGDYFEANYIFISPGDRDVYGDIHVGKLSAGWKPLMQANKHFDSIDTLKRWYEQNKDEYFFIDSGNEAVSFEDYLCEIDKRNRDTKLKRHENYLKSDGYDWTSAEFS